MLFALVLAVNDLSMLSLTVETVVSLNYRYRRAAEKEHVMNEGKKLILNITNGKNK